MILEEGGRALPCSQSFDHPSSMNAKGIDKLFPVGLYVLEYETMLFLFADVGAEQKQFWRVSPSNWSPRASVSLNHILAHPQGTVHVHFSRKDSRVLSAFRPPGVVSWSSWTPCRRRVSFPEPMTKRTNRNKQGDSSTVPGAGPNSGRPHPPKRVPSKSYSTL